ncbi:MAG TPA: hypothetical protein VIZ32_03215 [Vicinamibacterales bacterium]
MSLLRPIIRTCAVGALRDKTWAENRVYDSDLTPLAEAVLGTAAKPYIVVYTDNDDRTPAAVGEMYAGTTRQLQLTIEIGVASAIHDPDQSDNIVIRFSSADEGMEWACDIIESQAIAALYGDPHSDWGDLLKRFAPRVIRMPSRRGGQSERGVKFAARRTTFVISTIYDFAPGVVPVPGSPVWDFLRLCRASQALGVVDRASIVEQLLNATPNADWRIAQAYLGMDTQSIKNVNPDGVPLPWGKYKVEAPVEMPPLDDSDKRDDPPVFEDIHVYRESPYTLPGPWGVAIEKLVISRPLMTKK